MQSGANNQTNAKSFAMPKGKLNLEELQGRDTRGPTGIPMSTALPKGKLNIDEHEKDPQAEKNQKRALQQKKLHERLAAMKVKEQKAEAEK